MDSTEKIERSEGFMDSTEKIERLEGVKQNMQRISEDNRAKGMKLQNSEDIAKVQFDILSGLSRFERTLDFPETDIEGFVNEGQAMPIDNNQRVILRVVNEISRNMIGSGLIYKTLNTGGAQEILEAITVKIKDLRLLFGLDHDINLLQPEGQYPVSLLHTNLQIASFYLQGLEEQIDQLLLPTAIPDSSATVSSQKVPVRGDDDIDYYHDRNDDDIDYCHDRDDDDGDPEGFRRDEDYEYDYYNDTSPYCQYID